MLNSDTNKINTNKIGKKMSPSRSVPEIAVQVVEDVGEKCSQRSMELFSNV